MKIKVNVSTDEQNAEPRRHPVHPGLTTSHRCIKCGAWVTFGIFQASDLAGNIAWERRMGFCCCGMWTDDEKKRLRFIRFNTGPVTPGINPLYATEDKK